MNDLQQLIESIYNSDKTLEQKVKTRLNEIQKEILLFFERKGKTLYPSPHDEYAIQREKGRICVYKVYIDLKKTNEGIKMKCISHNGSYDDLRIEYDEILTDESQINEKFDRWVIKQTMILLEHNFGNWLNK